MWKPRVLSSLLLVSVVTIALVAVVLVAAQGSVASGPASPSAQAGDPAWQTWVNGAAWTQGMQITAETSDTIEVVNVVTTLPSQGIELVETWTPGELKLLDVQIEPGGSAHQVEIGKVTWQVPEGATQVYTMTKWFHVEPCTWTLTALNETLSIPGQPDGGTAGDRQQDAA